MEACLIEAQSIAAGQIAARLDWVDWLGLTVRTGLACAAGTPVRGWRENLPALSR